MQQHGCSQDTQNICITFIQCWSNVEDVGPALYKCYTNVLCLQGCSHDTLTAVHIIVSCYVLLCKDFCFADQYSKSGCIQISSCSTLEITAMTNNVGDTEAYTSLCSLTWNSSNAVQSFAQDDSGSYVLLLHSPST